VAFLSGLAKNEQAKGGHEPETLGGHQLRTVRFGVATKQNSGNK
jgi:hypothetical protein